MVTASAVDTYRCRPASTTAARTASARPRSAAQISLPAYREDLSLKDAAFKFGYRNGEQLDKWVRPDDMTYPLTNTRVIERPLAMGALRA
jgi:DNA primase